MEDDKYILELPVYTATEDRFFRDFNAKLEREVEVSLSRSGSPGKDREWFRSRVDRDREQYLKEFGGPWRYNQICGYLGVYPLGGQLRGDAWISFGRISRRAPRRRRIEFPEKEFELDIEPEESARTILENLLEEIGRLRKNKESRLYRRHVDISPLLVLGPFVDWRSLMDRSYAAGLGGLRASDFWDAEGLARFCSGR